MTEWRLKGVPTSSEAAEKVIDYDGKPISGNTRAGFLDGYERAEKAIVKALREEAFWIINGTNSVSINDVQCFSNGRLVFIPDE